MNDDNKSTGSGFYWSQISDINTGFTIAQNNLSEMQIMIIDLINSMNECYGDDFTIIKEQLKTFDKEIEILIEELNNKKNSIKLKAEEYTNIYDKYIISKSNKSLVYSFQNKENKTMSAYVHDVQINQNTGLVEYKLLIKTNKYESNLAGWLLNQFNTPETTISSIWDVVPEFKNIKIPK